MQDEYKICPKCKIEKTLTEFYKDKKKKDGLTLWCKTCVKRKMREYGKMHSKENRERVRQWVKDNPEKAKNTAKKWVKNNIERVAATKRKHYIANSEKIKKRSAIWYKENIEKARKFRNARFKERRKTEPKFVLNSKMSAGVNRALKEGKGGKSWLDLVDFTVKELQFHLEKQFKDGMSWKNMGEWHLDHKIPLSAFNFTKPEHEDFKKCWALKNLQPLWAEDNLKKNNKLTKHFQPSLLL